MGNCFSRALSSIILWWETSHADPEMNRELLRSGVHAVTILVLSRGGIRTLQALCQALPDTLEQLLASYYIEQAQVNQVLQVRRRLRAAGQGGPQGQAGAPGQGGAHGQGGAPGQGGAHGQGGVPDQEDLMTVEHVAAISREAGAMRDTASGQQAETIVRYLHQWGVITDEERDDCLGEATPAEQVNSVLGLITDREDLGFGHLIRALLRAGLHEIADRLYNTDVADQAEDQPLVTVVVDLDAPTIDLRTGGPSPAETDFFRVLGVDVRGGRCQIVDQNGAVLQMIEADGRTVRGVRYGSLHLDVYCPTEKSLLDLSILCELGKLQKVIMKQPEVVGWKEKYEVGEFKLGIKLEEFDACMKILRKKKEMKQFTSECASQFPSKANKDQTSRIPAVLTAVTDGDPKFLTKLLEHGEDANSGWPDGLSALHIAAQAGDDVIGTLLLNHGADPNKPDHHGNTPLMYAAGQNRVKFVQMMLEFKKIEVNLVNKQRETALHLAAKMGHSKILSALLNNKLHKVDTQVENTDGFKAIDLAFIENKFDAQRELALHDPMTSFGDVNVKAAMKLSQSVQT